MARNAATPSKDNKWHGLHIVSLDPGGTTGWTEHVVAGTHAKEPASTIKGGQIGPHEHHGELWKMLTRLAPDVVVCESFQYRIVKNQGVDMPGIKLISRDYIGIAKLFCELAGKEYIEQSPGNVKPLWTDLKLMKLGVYSKGAPHRNDATRHMLHFIVQTLGRKDYLSPLRPVDE